MVTMIPACGKERYQQDVFRSKIAKNRELKRVGRKGGKGLRV